MKVRLLLFVLLCVMLFAGCENIFARPATVPPPPSPESGETQNAALPVIIPQRVYLVSRIACPADGSRVDFTLYNPTDVELNLEPSATPKERKLIVVMNDYPLRGLATYCGKKTIQPGESLDCKRSLESDADRIGFLRSTANAGSAQENLIEARTPGYSTMLTFECGGNKASHALTELSCAGDALQFGVRNIFPTPMYLGQPTNGSGLTQNEYLHVQLNSQELMDLNEHCSAEVLNPGETANCQIEAVPLQTDDANTVSARYKLYHVQIKFPCP